MTDTGEREAPALVTCPRCGSTVPTGKFCGHCGANLSTGNARRSNAYAAVPNQRVAQLAIVSTLFPHLPHRRSGPFRVALVAGGALVVMLAAMHLFAPEVGLMGTSGIVAPCILQAAGAGYSFKLLKTSRVAVAFFGDGAVNNGAFHDCSVPYDEVFYR